MGVYRKPTPAERELLTMISVHGGSMNYDDERLARFRSEKSTLSKPDVFNACHDLGWLVTEHDGHVGTVRITDRGRTVLTKHYRVSWEIDVDAENPEEAILKVAAHMGSPEFTPLDDVFTAKEMQDGAVVETMTIDLLMLKRDNGLDHARAVIWEVKTGISERRYFTDKAEADFAHNDAVSRGLPAQTNPIPVPQDHKQLADLLQSMWDTWNGVSLS